MRRITRTFRLPAGLVERFDQAAELAGVNKTDVIVKAIEDFILQIEREKVVKEVDKFNKYVKFGNVLREKLGEQAGIHTLQLSDAINVSKHVDKFMQRFMKLCIDCGVQIPDLMPTDPEFTEKAQAILLGMAGMEVE